MSNINDATSTTYVSTYRPALPLTLRLEHSDSLLAAEELSDEPVESLAGDNGGSPPPDPDPVKGDDSTSVSVY